MSRDRFAKTLGKMTPGTFGGQSRAAQPVNVPGSLSPGSRPTPGCTCSYVQAFSDEMTLTLSSTTTDYADASFSAIVREEGGWTLSGGQLAPPDNLVLYTIHAVANFSDSSGNSPVTAILQITDGMGASIYSNNIPGFFNGDASGSRLLSFHPSGITPGFSALVERPSAGIRELTVRIEVWITALCGCDAPVIG